MQKTTREVRRAAPGSVMSHASKFVRDSFAVSFALSAMHYCDKACRLWDQCYASRQERLYSGLRDKLRRHWAMGPTRVVNRAMAELCNWRGPLRWARLAMDGSLPARGDMSPRRFAAFSAALRRLVIAGKAMGADWHIPVETYGKAQTYRSIFRGLGVLVRRSSQATTVAQLCKASDPRSWVAAERLHNSCVTNDEKLRNTAIAYEAAAEIRSHGQTAIVCPAVARDSKCGQCTACADSRIDVVVYPFHG